ncbi:MAG: dNTP triphosphohydrolase [Eubacterium sp.]|nr:dNTP triphosphohydrolase [Eubacterium sp.]
MFNVIIVKNKLNAKNRGTTQRNHNIAEESLQRNEERIYSCRSKDKENLKSFFERNGKDGFILLVSYNNEGKIKDDNITETEIEDVYIGEIYDFILNQEKDEYQIKYLMKKKITDKRIIINILDGIDMDLASDYEDYSYVMARSLESLYNSVKDFLIKGVSPQLFNNYREIDETYKLSDYAQKNHMCRRMYGKLPEDKTRSEFQRDRERIVNSKAFRRLVDKAQIFSADKGDHYRTRMTHTLEVNQIAKAISVCLGLNVDLTEAIALAHDLGHTPFGHQGERTIQKILEGKELKGLFNISDQNARIGGFKHNYQSIRVMTKLEEKYIEYSGLDISFQVLEGALKHTKLKREENNIEEFIHKEFVEELHMDRDFCSNLEGQVVAVADEIAQRGHDIDDAITSGLISVDELIDALSSYKFQDLFKRLKNENEKINDNSRHYINKRELIVGRVISCIVSYFIKDVVQASEEEIKKKKLCNDDGIFNEKLIVFSKNGEKCCQFIEKLVNKRVIADSEVAKFDSNADIIIKKLFEAYYKNPKLLHSGTLRKIYVDMLSSENEEVANSAIDLINGNLEVVGQEIKEITVDVITDISNEAQRVLFEKRKILIRNIVDYIAGMTDSYAKKEYEELL